MTDFIDDVDTEDWEEFERLGRRAGAELRTAPPDSAIEGIERAVRRRAMTRVVAGTLAVALLAGAAFAMFRGREGADDTPVDQTTEPTVPLPAGAPGTWRELADTDLPVSTAFDLTGTWTGSKLIVLGGRSPQGGSMVAAAYDVRDDAWQPVAPPPEELQSPFGSAWTGSELLVLDGRGHVVSYDPDTDSWRARSAPDVDVRFAGDVSRFGVSESGVLARSAGGWWWYDEAADVWSAVPSPDAQFDRANSPTAAAVVWLEALTPDAFVQSTYDGPIAFTVFDVSSKTWTPTREVEIPPVTRMPPRCQTADAHLVCFAEGSGTLDGVVIDVGTAESMSFTLGSHSNSLSTVGTPWFGHAWRLLLARTAEWEALPPLKGVTGFSAAVWDGQEMLMFGTTGDTGERSGPFAAAYTPVVKP